eukprot:jgi/Ulvmu1/9857/UM057_0011.1
MHGCMAHACIYGVPAIPFQMLCALCCDLQMICLKHEAQVGKVAWQENAGRSTQGMSNMSATCTALLAPRSRFRSSCCHACAPQQSHCQTPSAQHAYKASNRFLSLSAAASARHQQLRGAQQWLQPSARAQRACGCVRGL